LFCALGLLQLRVVYYNFNCNLYLLNLHLESWNDSLNFEDQDPESKAKRQVNANKELNHTQKKKSEAETLQKRVKFDSGSRISNVLLV
jgi:hypothetical protein